MRKLTGIAAVLALLLAGCATTLVDDDFTGPTAVVRDTYASLDTGHLFRADRADFFVLARVDGKVIEHALQKTEMLNSGAGFRLTPYEQKRRVPIRPMQAELRAETYYAAPVSALFNETHEVSGAVRFEPVAGESYVVTGELRDGYAAVWIETAAGRVVTEKVVRRK